MQNLLINALATRRLTRLVLDDKITESLRTRILDKYPPESTLTGYLMTCPWCVSIYAGTALVALTTLTPKVGYAAASILAYSEATGLLAENGF